MPRSRRSPSSGHLWWKWQVAAAQAEAAWLDGRPEQVAAVTEETFRLALRVGSPHSGSRSSSPATGPAPPSGGARAAASTRRRSRSPRPIETSRSTARTPSCSDSAHGRRRGSSRAGFASAARGPRTRAAADDPREPGQPHASRLDVLVLLGEGLRNRDIGARLHLSHRTVEHHVASVLHKLGARTRSESVRAGVRLGLL